MTIQKDAIYQGKIFDDVFLHILSVDESKNMIKAEVNDCPKVLSFRYDTFEKLYQLTDNVYTRVVFKYDKEDGQIVAFLLDVGERLCYAHIGQHSGYNLEYAQSCRPTKNPEAYQALKEELESIGYFVKVVKKLS